MAYKTSPSTGTSMFNKFGFNAPWPRGWIVVIGVVLIFFTFAIAGMEAGHTVVELFRSTAFGGFIVFFPLLTLGIFVLVTACVPKLALLRVTVALCAVMIFLCLALIVYDIFVLIDPTRCFFLSCSYATFSTGSGTYTGWPVTIAWPTDFDTQMTRKRIFQGVQLFCAVIYIFFAGLYILTYAIYRHVRTQQQVPYHVSRSVHPTYESGRASARLTARATTPPRPVTRTMSRTSNYAPPPYTHLPANHKVTVYTLQGKPNTTRGSRSLSRAPSRPQTRAFVRPRSNSMDEVRLCTRCNREPKIVLGTHYERQNYFSHLCENCNKELSYEHQKAPHPLPDDSRHWIP